MRHSLPDWMVRLLGIEAADAGEGTVLLALADRVRRLAPSHRNPETFHIEKSEIEHSIRTLARKLA